MIKRIWRSGFEFVRKMNEDHVAAYAAQAAYFVVLSLIPFLLVLLTSVQYTPITREQVTDAVVQICPETIQDFITDIVDEVYTKSLAVVPVSAILALWSAGKAILSITNGLNSIYKVKETRNFAINRIQSVFYTIILLIAIIVTLILLVFGNSIQREITSYLPFLENVIAIIISLRTVITLVLLAVVFVLLYRFVPNRKSDFKSQLPGAVLTAIAWSLTSFGFSIYFDYFGGMSDMYGSMTSIILFMLWVYICMYIVMIGAELNCYYEDTFETIQLDAAAKIKEEYHQLIGLHENKDDDKKSS